MIARTERRYWFHRHPKLTLSALTLCGCIVGLIVTELTARVLFPAWAPAREERVKFWTYDELLGWAHTPNQRGRFNHRDFSVEVVHNSQGMRDSEYSMERTEKKRMLVLGDSFGWGFGVEHHERFSEILEHAHPNWEIMNASVSGYGTDQQFLFLKERGIAFKPDVVLLLFHPNDFENNRHAEESWHFKPFFVIERGQLKLQNVPVPKATTRQRLQRLVLGRTHLGSRVSRAMKFFFPGLEHQGAVQQGSVTSSQETNESMHEVTYHLITAMHALCKKNGSDFMLVSAPMNTKKRTFLQKIAAEENIPYLPLDAHFASTVTSITFPHDEHWNVQGHAIAANAIAAFVWKRGVLDAAKPEQ